MRSTWRILALMLVLLLLLVPLAAQADGPCPDDPDIDCYPDTPPFYVVINRDFEDFNRKGSGCQPIILNNPGCKDCGLIECTAIDIEGDVCQYLPAAAGDTLYAMCCDCATDPDGQWWYTEYELDGAGGCTMVSEGPMPGLPPGTGIDLPAPVIIGGLAIIGAVLLGAGLLVRRRTLRVA
jgi:hypothetical protein